jgi:hypothetical protein
VQVFNLKHDGDRAGGHCGPASKERLAHR